MNHHRNHFSVAIALLCTATLAHAGFLLETTPPSPQPATASAGARSTPVVPGVAVPSAGRNVDMSAKLDRVGKMNRQRIDLESRLTSRISQTGETPPELPIIKGMGRDVTFEDALRQILPSGWSAYSDQDLPMEMKVNWTGNRTWPMVLHTLLAERDMRANVDWKNQEIMFFVPAVKEEVTKPVAVDPSKGVELRALVAKPVEQPVALEAKAVELRGIEVPKVTETKAAADAKVAPVAEPRRPEAKVAEASKAPKVEVKEVVWTLSPDHTLRENLRRWSSAANWNLVWNAVSGDSVIDYPVDAKVEFTGELLGASGAMAKVITAYRDADYPLEIEFFRGNRVVEVRLHRVPDVKTVATEAPRPMPPRAELPPKQEPVRIGSTPAGEGR